jgi:REP element-mobilizing transposase RayT
MEPYKPQPRKRAEALLRARILQNRHCRLYRINGVHDHVHLLLSLYPTLALVDLVKDIQAGTAHWNQGRLRTAEPFGLLTLANSQGPSTVETPVKGEARARPLGS